MAYDCVDIRGKMIRFLAISCHYTIAKGVENQHLQL
jgi:hypothetical protein